MTSQEILATYYQDMWDRTAEETIIKMFIEEKRWPT